MTIYFLKTLQLSLNAGQRLVTSGGFDGELQNKAMFVCLNTSPERDNSLNCNAEEADSYKDMATHSEFCWY